MERHPAIFLATHGETIHRECVELLVASGYEVRALDGGSPEGTDEVVAVSARRVTR
jgi:hypothetical protein